MGKPGQRTSHIEIVDRPELRSPLRRLAETTVTAALWAAWSYFIVPILVTLVLWIFGAKMVYQSLLDPDHLKELHGILSTGGISLLAIFIVNLAWSNYNYYFIYRKFQHRRLQARTCVDAGFASFFGMDPRVLDEAKAHNRFVVVLADGKAAIESATTIPPAAPSERSAS